MISRLRPGDFFAPCGENPLKIPALCATISGKSKPYLTFEREGIF